jgi:2-amino-4-hydroxy-6-hydroxymethyldihydropteridine diphosphokinase
MARFYLSLGASLGHRRVALEAALSSLPAWGVPLDRFSSLYEAEPVGGRPGDPWFLNMVASGPLEAGAPPAREMAERLLEVEARAGRRREGRNRPRVVDLDLLLYGDQVIRQPGLMIPHPRLHRRRFVLVPLAEIAPGLILPSIGRRVEVLLRALPAGGEVRPAGSLGPTVTVPPGTGRPSCGPRSPVL